MIMILGSNHINLKFLFDVFVGLKVVVPVLSELVIVVLIIEVFVSEVIILRASILIIIHDLIESFGSFLFEGMIRIIIIRQWFYIYLELRDLLVDILHCLLEIVFFSVNWEVNGFEWGQGIQCFFICNRLHILCKDAFSHSHKFLHRKLHPKSIDKSNKPTSSNIVRICVNFSFSWTIDSWQNILESETMFLHKILFEVLNSTIEFYLFLEWFCYLEFPIIFYEFVFSCLVVVVCWAVKGIHILFGTIWKIPLETIVMIFVLFIGDEIRFGSHYIY